MSQGADSERGISLDPICITDLPREEFMEYLQEMQRQYDRQLQKDTEFDLCEDVLAVVASLDVAQFQRFREAFFTVKGTLNNQQSNSSSCVQRPQ